jgi:hypothetical protein
LRILRHGHVLVEKMHRSTGGLPRLGYVFFF